MTVWNNWSLDRLIIFFVGLSYLLIGIQVTLSHYRQNYHHKAMWYPVIESPILFITAISLTLMNSTWLFYVVQILFWIGLLSGMIGFRYHFHGVGVRVGGYAGRNFLVGPPVILPVLFAAMSALGLMAMYWG